MNIIKQVAWNTFKNTGNIDTFMELLKVQDLEKSLNINNNVNENLKVSNYGDNKDQGFDNFRE